MLLGPPGKAKSYNEIGRAIATLMVDDVSLIVLFEMWLIFCIQSTENSYHPYCAILPNKLGKEKLCPLNRPKIDWFYPQLFSDVAYKARDREDLIAGIDEFLDEVIVLPPGEWDPKIRIEPPKKIPSADQR